MAAWGNAAAARVRPAAILTKNSRIGVLRSRAASAVTWLGVGKCRMLPSGNRFVKDLWLVERFESLARLELLGGRGGERDADGLSVIERDLEGVGAGAGERHVEDQYRAGLDFHHAGRRLAELHGPLAAEELAPVLVHEADAHRVHADLRATPLHPEDQVGPWMERGELGYPDVLEDTEHAELALLVDEGVIRDDREVELDESVHPDRVDDVILPDRVHHVHALRYLPEDRVLAVE